MARKPIEGTIADNCLKHGCGALNVDGCRIEAQSGDIGNAGASVSMHQGYDRPWMHDKEHLEAWLKRKQESNDKAQMLGRWPANIVLDESDEVQELFPVTVGGGIPYKDANGSNRIYSGGWGKRSDEKGNNRDSGSASRFFFNFTGQ